MSRYIIADPAQGMGWGHIFSEKGSERERMTRFVFDKETASLIYVDVDRMGMAPTTNTEIADLEDSLKNANPEALEDPESWELVESDALPAWCAEAFPLME
ncbi:hypothetical protein RAD15_09090 [Bradyrhizobium sp. 14AA]